MSENSTRRRRTRFSFKTIENDKAYEELKKIPIIPSHRQLLEGSIFDAVSPNFKQLKDDISSLYSVVEKDVSNENRQIGLVELQLKKLLKRVNHAYNEITVDRDQNRAASYNSKLLGTFIDKEDKTQSLVNNIDGLIGDILNNIIKIDLRFPKKSQMLNEDLVNKQHYPLLFQLLNEKFPKSTPSLSTAPSSSSPPQSAPLEDPQEENSRMEPVDDQMKVSTSSSSSKPGIQLMIPTLRKKTSLPSTSTTLENINASDIINIKRSK